jgi:hypothetical protein
MNMMNNIWDLPIRLVYGSLLKDNTIVLPLLRTAPKTGWFIMEKKKTMEMQRRIARIQKFT